MRRPTTSARPSRGSPPAAAAPRRWWRPEPPPAAALLAVLLTLAAPPHAAASLPRRLPGLPAVVLSAPPDDARDDEAWRGRMLRLFADGVLRDERLAREPLARWAAGAPVAITLRGAVEPYVAFVEDLARDLARLTGLAVTVASDGRAAERDGMDVYVASNPRYWPPNVRSADPSVRVFTCAAAPGVRDGVIHRSTIRINAGVLDADEVRACLVEEIVQSLGLFGEIDDDDGTILNDRVGYEHIGIVDRMLLRALYDPRLTPGLDRASALPVAALVLGEELAAMVCREYQGGRRCDLP